SDPGERSSTIPWSPPPCSTGSCTAASSSTSTAKATGCAPTEPAPRNSQRGCAQPPGHRLNLTPPGDQPGKSDDRDWGISKIGCKRKDVTLFVKSSQP